MSKNVNAKLGTNARMDIGEKILRHRFETTEKALKAKHQALALDLYNHIYPENIRKLMDQFPSGFLPTHGTVSVWISGMCYRFELAHYLPGNNNAKYGGGHRFEEKTGLPAKLEGRVVAQTREEGEFKTQVSRAKDEVARALNAFNTYKQLLEGWPEVKPFVIVPEGPNRALPVAQVADLNAKLNLPVKTAKEKRSAPTKKAA